MYSFKVGLGTKSQQGLSLKRRPIPTPQLHHLFPWFHWWLSVDSPLVTQTSGWSLSFRSLFGIRGWQPIMILHAIQWCSCNELTHNKWIQVEHSCSDGKLRLIHDGSSTGTVVFNSAVLHHPPISTFQKSHIYIYMQTRKPASLYHQSPAYGWNFEHIVCMLPAWTTRGPPWPWRQDAKGGFDVLLGTSAGQS